MILFNLSGHGYFDMTAYDNYLAGNLKDFAYPAEKVRGSDDSTCRCSHEAEREAHSHRHTADRRPCTSATTPAR